MRKALLLSLLAAAFADTTFGVGAEPWQNWETSLRAGEPLVGKIWSADDGRFLTPYLLARALAEAKFILIGETHDNADHHRLQAWLIEEVATNRKPSVVMEMISRDQSEALKEYLAEPKANAAGLGPAIDWAERGWPDWLLYQPIAEVVLRLDLPLLPGDPSPAAIGAVRSGGLEAVDEPDRNRLALDAPLPPKLSEALNREIKESHCNLLPDASLASMAQVQRYRDAELASALVNADRGGGAILIAGNGHVRSDWGVPWYLARHHEPEERTTTVMLLEVEEGATTMSDLVLTGPEGAPAADYFWVTPGAEREDQCEKLRQRLGK